MSIIEKDLIRNIEAATNVNVFMVKQAAEFVEMQDFGDVLRCIDDVTAMSEDKDNILLRRLKASKDSAKFSSCVERIKKAMSSSEDRRLVINIIAKNYNSDEEVQHLVEVLLNSSLMSPSQITVTGREKLFDNINRHHVAQDSVVDDFNISKLFTETARSAGDPGRARAEIMSRVNSSFFGSETYDPGDPRNALAPVIDYWATGLNLPQDQNIIEEDDDPNAPPPVADEPVEGADQFGPAEYDAFGNAITKRAVKRGVQLGTHAPNGKRLLGRPPAIHHDYSNRNVLPTRDRGYEPGRHARHNSQYSWPPEKVAKNPAEAEKKFTDSLNPHGDPRGKNVRTSGYPGLMPNDRGAGYESIRIPDFMQNPECLKFKHNPEPVRVFAVDQEEGADNPTIAELEARADQRYKYLIDHGVKHTGPEDEENQEFIRKYFFYITLLSEVQGLQKRVALFHEGGFAPDQQDANGRKIFSTEYLPGPAAIPGTEEDGDRFSLPEITSEDIDDFIRGFMGFLGIRSREVASEQEQAAQSGEAGGEEEELSVSEQIEALDSALPEDEAQLAKVDQKARSEIVKKIADFRRHYPQVNDYNAKLAILAVYTFRHLSRIINHTEISEDLIQQYFGKEGYGLRNYINDAEEVASYLHSTGSSEIEEIANKLGIEEKTANSSKSIKTAAIHPTVRSHSWFRFIMNKIRERGSYIAAESVTSEYVLSALLSYIHKQISIESSFDDSDLPENNEKVLSQVSTNKAGTKKGISRNDQSWPAFIIRFSSQEQQNFGIDISDEERAKNDFDAIFNSGRPAYILIKKENGGYTPVESSIVHAYIVNSPSGGTQEYSINGPYLKVSLAGSPIASHIQEDIAEGSYQLFFPDRPIKSIKGLKKDLYGYLYGHEHADRMTELHQNNGIDISMSPYPWWAPSLYDFREKVEGEERDAAIGHPNNAYNIRRKLEETVQIRDSLVRKSKISTMMANENRSSLEVLDKAIQEMRMVLFHWHHFTPDARVLGQKSENDLKSKIKDRSKSLMRHVSDDYARFDEIKRRCNIEGIPLGFSNVYFTPEDENLNHILSKEDYAKFVQIRSDVEKEYSGKKNIMIIRGADAGLNETQGNGLFYLRRAPQAASTGNVPGQAAPARAEFEMAWMADFASDITSLKSQIAEQKQAGRKEFSSHVIIISEEPIPSVSSGNESASILTHIVIPVEVIDSKEISEIADFYLKETKKEIIEKLENSKENVSDASIINRTIEAINNFAIPFSYIKSLQIYLSNANFQRVTQYIQKEIRSILEDISVGGNVQNIIETKKAGIASEALTIRQSDSVLERLNIKADAPKFSVDEYVVQKNSAWDGYINSNLVPIVEKLKNCKKQTDVFQRLVDVDLCFGKYSVKEPDENGVVAVVFDPTDSLSAPSCWFQLAPESMDIQQFEPDMACQDFAALAGFSVNETIYDKLKSGIDKGVKYKYIQQNLSVCKSKIMKFVDKYHSEMKEEKCKFPVLLVLGGSPGTGKSIFPEVLAASLECSYLHSTMTSIMNSGTPQLRGGSEQNMIQFLNMCRNRENSILLIDEFDNYILTGGLQAGADDVRKALGELKKCWDQSGDYPTYKGHNFHIVLTTNNLQTLISNSETQALMSRSEKQTVELPSDEITLKEMFSGKAIVNNLINFMCGEDIVLCQMAKQLIDLYAVENPDENNKNSRDLFIRRIKARKPEFFQNSCIIKPNKAKEDMAKNLGLTYNVSKEPKKVSDELYRSSRRLGESADLQELIQAMKMVSEKISSVTEKTISKDDVDRIIDELVQSQDLTSEMGEDVKRETSFIFELNHVEEFVHGWNYINSAFNRTNRTVSMTNEDGSSRQFNPMDIVCKYLSEEMVFPGATRNGVTKKYAKTTMRDLVFDIKRMFDNHQGYLSGDRNSVPFNYKTFVTMFFSTKYAPTMVTEAKTDREDWADADFQRRLGASIQTEVKGMDGIKKYMGIGSPYDGCPPPEILNTEEDFAENMRTVAQMIKSSNYVTEDDGGVESTKNLIVSKFALNDDSFGTKLESFNRDLVAKNQASSKPFADITSAMIIQRKQLSDIIQTETDKQSLMEAIIMRVDFIRELYDSKKADIANYRKTTMDYEFKKYLDTWKKIESIYDICGNISTIHTILQVGSSSEAIAEKWKDVEAEANEAQAAYVGAGLGNRSQADIYALLSGKIQSEEVKGVIGKIPVRATKDVRIIDLIRKSRKKKINDEAIRKNLTSMGFFTKEQIDQAFLDIDKEKVQGIPGVQQPQIPIIGQPPVTPPPAITPPQPSFVQTPTPPAPAGATGPTAPGSVNAPVQPGTAKKIAKPPQSGLATGIKPPTSSSVIPEGQIKTSTDHFYNYALKFFESKKARTAQTVPAVPAAQAAPAVETKPIPAVPTTTEVTPVSVAKSAENDQLGSSISSLVKNSRMFGEMDKKVSRDLGQAHKVLGDDYVLVIDCPQAKTKATPVAPVPPVKK
jgi:SpoVK/Ycf46/Vps4 family AAA+-type ATPase